MLKKSIKYTDYNGVERSEDFYFNLSKAEVIEMETTTAGGYANMLENIIKAQDLPSIVSIFKELVLKAYGQKSPDGKRFIKSEELSTEFSQTEAYTNIFMELAMDADAASKFVNGIIPADLDKIVADKPALVTNGN